MKTKHTSGPWHTGTDEDGHVVYDDQLEYVAAAGRDDGDADAEGANARLIAAAPEMLEGCQAVLVQLDYLQNLWSKEGITSTLANRLRAAIAKATGEAP